MENSSYYSYTCMKKKEKLFKFWVVVILYYSVSKINIGYLQLLVLLLYHYSLYRKPCLEHCQNCYSLDKNGLKILRDECHLHHFFSILFAWKKWNEMYPLTIFITQHNLPTIPFIFFTVVSIQIIISVWWTHCEISRKSSIQISLCYVCTTGWNI